MGLVGFRAGGLKVCWLGDGSGSQVWAAPFSFLFFFFFSWGFGGVWGGFGGFGGGFRAEPEVQCRGVVEGLRSFRLTMLFMLRRVLHEGGDLVGAPESSCSRARIRDSSLNTV